MKTELRSRIKSIIQEECVLNSRVKLSGGLDSSYYFDIKKASLKGHFLSPFTDYVLDYLLPEHSLQPDLVGGLTLGADFITAALVTKSYEKGRSIQQGSIVRKEIKKHGTENLIENNLSSQPTGKTILVVEDVITSGRSIEQAYLKFVQIDYRVVAFLTVVDREQGGVDYLKEKYHLPVIALFKASDFNF